MNTVLKTPDITPAQIVGGIPIIGNLLNAFGVYTLTAAQTESLQETTLYAIGLLGADALIRFGRSISRMNAPMIPQDEGDARQASGGVDDE